MSIAINVIIIGWFKYINEEQADTSTKVKIYSEIWSEVTLDILGIILICLCSLLLISWLGTSFSLLNKKSWRDFIEYNRTEEDPEKFKELESRSKLQIKPARELSLTEVRSLLRFYGKDAKEFNQGKSVEFGHLIVWIEYVWISTTFIINNGTFRYYCLLIMFNVFGLLVSPAFFSFHLLDIVGRSPTLQDVIKSVTNNISELSLTGMLGLIIIYIFSAFGFTFFYDEYFDEEVNRDITSERGQSVCKNLFH